MAAKQAAAGATTTQVGDLPEACLAQAIARTSPRDACRCAAVSPAFRPAADSDHVWRSFLPPQLDHKPTAAVVLQPAPAPPASAKSKKDAYLGICDAAGPAAVDGCRMWLARATGARCYALSARRLSLPWDDGELCWKFAPHPLSRFGEVAELVDCTCLDIYGSLPAAALTPGVPYAAYLVYDTAAEGCHRGLSYPNQETAVGGRVVVRHDVCLRPDDAATRKFRGGGGGARPGGGGEDEPRRPRRREDGWWEMEMGRLCTAGQEEEVVASFEVLGWYPKRSLIVEGIELRPVVVHNSTAT